MSDAARNAEDHGICHRNKELSESHSTATLDDVFLADVLYGLGQPDKRVSSKYFYDQRGSELFNQICELDEYYLTRTELEIMELYADDMADQLSAGVRLIEYGSGSSIKTRLLLDRLLPPATYVPVDISEEHLAKIAADLRRQYPQIEIIPVVADFTKSFALPRARATVHHNAVYFPGSTIGNFEHHAAEAILQRIARTVGRGGGLLIGIDLHKESEVIERAYNDSENITAAFNKNLLVRMNRELDADFDVDRFRHHSVYNQDEQRIESSLVSKTDQIVTIDGRQFEFRSGEHLHTEYSHKYSIDGFARFAAKTGLVLHKYWTDPHRLFGVLHLVVG